LFVFCALADFEALAPVTGAFQLLGQVIASALRITELTEQKPEVTFPQSETPAPEKDTLTLRVVSFRYPDQPINALNALSL
ncbi:cysteine/glutathione ABC transporter ATP-binding protein/permease CydC, partial [Salmonella enterica subsp. enterica]